MNPELQKCRAYYELLGGEAQQRKTAQHLLTAIQIAEKSEKQVLDCVVALQAVKARKTIGDEAEARKLVIAVLASVTKPEGE